MYLVIDPGETVGLAMFDTALRNKHIQLTLMDAFQVKAETVEDFAFRLYMQELRGLRPTEVIVEDYRVYKASAAQHVGNRLFTPELIGAIRALCAIFVPRIPVIVYPANVKGSWPDAKLDKYFPEHADYKSLVHAHDCIQLGLYHAHEALKWDSTTGVET